jgi:hypothetical protein
MEYGDDGVVITDFHGMKLTLKSETEEFPKIVRKT